MIRILIIACLFSTACFPVFSQHRISNYSHFIGKWQLVSPKNSPGPEFISESYKGISNFSINTSEAFSIAVGITVGTSDTAYWFTFIPMFDGKRLSGEIQTASWTTNTSSLQVSVPIKYDDRKDRIVIHINNPEYGNVKFIYQRVK